MRLTGMSNGEWFLRAHDRYSLAATRQLAKVSEMLTKNFSLSYSSSNNNSYFSRTAWLSRHQKDKLLWILMKQVMMG